MTEDTNAPAVRSGWRDLDGKRECDLVMKGGITSGVIYPKAITEFARSYRLRSIGGASAGAIGAALAAAAEYGRFSESGGFELLNSLPKKLRDGKLGSLFQPQKSTRALLPVMLAVAEGTNPGVGPNKFWRTVGALLHSFPLASALSVVPGLAILVFGMEYEVSLNHGSVLIWPGFALVVVASILVLLLGLITTLAVRVIWKLARAVPRNGYGICTGLGVAGGEGFTDWLSSNIDAVAGLQRGVSPLTFGQLYKWPDQSDPRAASEHYIELSMMTTSLSLSRAFQIPAQHKNFFYDPVAWRGLFPEYVVNALDAASDSRMELERYGSPKNRDYLEDLAAQSHMPPLKRLPEDKYLPVIVVTRMSLSFPLLISAVQLWQIDYTADRSSDLMTVNDNATSDVPPVVQPTQAPPVFRRLWFTDGGLCSNFPIHMFDAALPVRPTFAINLGRFHDDSDENKHQKKNIEFAQGNDVLAPQFTNLPTSGFGALVGFVVAAINTARGWSDNSRLDFPGSRDRIVRVLQTKSEGGLNLNMDSCTISKLAERGRVAAAALVTQFNTAFYPTASPARTGWENHRWVRYRAMTAALPAFLDSYQKGRQGLDIATIDQPSYHISGDVAALAATIDDAILTAARTVSDNAASPALEELRKTPRPIGDLRREPRL